MKRFLTALPAVLFLLFLAACGTSSAEETPADPVVDPQLQEPETPPEPTPEELAAQEVETLLSSLTMEEKVGQLFFVRCPTDAAVEDIGAYHLGGYILFGRDFADKTADAVIQTHRDYQRAAEADTGIPLLIGVDEEGGTVVRVSSNPHLRSRKYHSPQTLLQTGGTEALAADTAAKDALLSALGINVNLAPVADVTTDPASFIYDRTCGLDAAGTAECVAAMVRQMAADHIGSVLKHFPGYGSNADTHTGIAVDRRPLDTFRTADFLPFSAGIEAGAGRTAVLVSHNIMTAVDDALPASLSPAVHVLLRTELKFDGVVMTDDLAMDAVSAYAGDGAVAVMALQAGNDLIITTDYRTQIHRLPHPAPQGPGRGGRRPAGHSPDRRRLPPGIDLETGPGPAVRHLVFHNGEKPVQKKEVFL